MNVRRLTDRQLVTIMDRLAGQERVTITHVLLHLREVERRRLFAKLKYSSLFAYVTLRLKYSEGQAVRRIAAMRLLYEFPEIEPKIRSGDLSLTNLYLAQMAFRRVDKTRAEKKDLLRQLEKQSTRQGQKIVGNVVPEMQIRELSFNDIQDDTLREKLLLVKGMYAHSDPNLSLVALLHKLCDNALVENSPSAPKVNSQAEIMREVRRRDEGKCRNCGSTFALEIDHIVPRAAGGSSTLENLRLLCRNCNQRAAIEYFGVEYMEQFLKRTPTEDVPASNCNEVKSSGSSE